MRDLIELAERCEAADGPDRELDAAIALAKGWTQVRPDWFTPPNLTVLHHKSEMPAYTASVDAALTLVPVGWMWGVGCPGPDTGPWGCLTMIAEPCTDIACHAATPALAITAACLRAIAGEGE